MIRHQWKLQGNWAMEAMVACDRCGILAFKNYDRDTYVAARSYGHILVGQIVPEDCEQVTLQMVHES